MTSLAPTPSLYQNVKTYEKNFRKFSHWLKELECSGGRLQSLRNGKTSKYPQALTLMISYHTSDPDLVYAIYIIFRNEEKVLTL